MKNRYLEEYIDITKDLLSRNAKGCCDFLVNYADNVKSKDIRNVNVDYANKVAELSVYLRDRFVGKSPKPIIIKRDKRFSDEDWDTNPILDFIKQFYLLTYDWVEQVAEKNGKDKNKDLIINKFIAKQLLDAIAPSNIPFLNPAIIKEFINTGGKSVLNGYLNFLDDIDENGELNLSTTDKNYYVLGKNIAITPGKVVFQNDIMQLIQYEATTEKVFKTPILILPPWVNKYYVMDLSQDNSIVKWLVDSGYTVFIVSWVNPNKSHADKSFDDYLQEGLFDALEKINELTGADETNAIGYCLGGILLASGIAYLKNPKCKKRLKNKIKTVTLIATLTDFSDVGDFFIFTDKDYIKKLEKIMDKYGFLPGKVMFKTFNSLKTNDMVWSTVIRNYLMGKKPVRMDVLYWNADYTNMPRKEHSFFLRNFYRDNLFCKKNGIKLLGVPIDLSLIDLPVFMISAEKDHIAPWRSTFSATKIFKGPLKFVLGGSGHIAGVVNPINSNKYGYWVNEKLCDDPEEWFSKAKKYSGSWWKEWLKWIQKFSDKMVEKRVINNWIEDAPGSYVIVSSESEETNVNNKS